MSVIHQRGIISLGATAFLCLPSLAGGVALLLNLLRQRPIEEWGNASIEPTALGAFFGGPLICIAAFVGLLVTLRQDVFMEVKAAHLAIVLLGAIAAIGLILRFAS
jgi:hypothetical protein